MTNINPVMRLFLLSGVIFSLLQQINADSNLVSKFSFSANDVADNLITVVCIRDGQKTTGCGFIAVQDGAPYLFTSQHLILGADKIDFRSSTGRSIRPKSIELSANRNVARMALVEGSGLTLSVDPAMGEVVGVFNCVDPKTPEALFGKVTGLGAEIVEVSADFEDAHSGSPILNTDQQIIGIASYTRESGSHAMKKGTRFENKTRRFCCRIDRINWTPVNWKHFNKEYGSVFYESRILTDEVIDILMSWADEPFGRIRLEEGPQQMSKDWIKTHNKVVSQYRKGANYDRKFSSDYSESTEELANLCRTRSRKINMIAEQRGLTEYLRSEYQMMADTLEYAAEIIEHYSKSAY